MTKQLLVLLLGFLLSLTITACSDAEPEKQDSDYSTTLTPEENITKYEDNREEQPTRSVTEIPTAQENNPEDKISPVPSSNPPEQGNSDEVEPTRPLEPDTPAPPVNEQLTVAENWPADTFWKPEYFVSEDENGEPAVYPSTYWQVELYLYSDGSGLLLDDHFTAPNYSHNITWSVNGQELLLTDEFYGQIYKGKIWAPDAEYPTGRVELYMREFGEQFHDYVFAGMPMPERNYPDTALRMQEIAGDWIEVSGITEGWIWLSEDEERSSELQILQTDEGMDLVWKNDITGRVNKTTQPLLFVEEWVNEFVTYPWHLITQWFEAPGSSEPLQFEITLLDNNILQLIQYYTVDGYVTCSEQFYQRKGTKPDEAAIIAKTEEILNQSHSEETLALWKAPDISHPLEPVWRSMRKVPCLLVAIAPEVTVTLCEGRPIFEADEIVGFEESWPVQESVTLKRGEHTYVGLDLNIHDLEFSYMYHLQIERDGETILRPVIGADDLEDGGWRPLIL